MSANALFRRLAGGVAFEALALTELAKHAALAAEEFAQKEGEHANALFRRLVDGVRHEAAELGELALEVERRFVDGIAAAEARALPVVLPLGVGDFVQWEREGILQMPAARRIEEFLGDGYARLEGSATGVPVAELVRAEAPVGQVDQAAPPATSDAPIAVSTAAPTTEAPTTEAPATAASTTEVPMTIVTATGEAAALHADAGDRVILSGTDGGPLSDQSAPPAGNA